MKNRNCNEIVLTIEENVEMLLKLISKIGLVYYVVGPSFAGNIA